MFYLSYLFSELRRHKGGTLLTALGLGVGVGLVVTVSALTTGLDEAQEKVLKPLTGVGTDTGVLGRVGVAVRGWGWGSCGRWPRGSVEVGGSVFTLRLPSAGVEGADELRIEGKHEGGVRS